VRSPATCAREQLLAERPRQLQLIVLAVRLSMRRYHCERSAEDAPMIVKQIWTGNAYRNFNYLIACSETGEALAVDPLDYEKCLKAARDEGWSIRQILNTHEHHDHTGGNEPMARATGAKLLAHKNAKDKIPGIARGLGAGDVIKVGKTVELEALDTPGHTMSHVCLLAHTDQPALFCGDTLFNAGAGNCHHGGHPAELYKTFSGQLARLPSSTSIYPGHDYIEKNLRFTLDREPDNKAAREVLEKVSHQDPSNAYVSTLAVEREINTFFRLTSPTVIARLREAFPDLPESPDERTVFLKLRELRNAW
jgi:hydroxyacylglutathione hydrolase